MNFVAKVAEKFECEICNYNCSKKSDYDKHLLTRKHKNRTKLNNLEQNLEQKIADDILQEFKCPNCSKSYKARNSLWYHQQKCNIQDQLNQLIPNHLEGKTITNFNDLIPDKVELFGLIKYLIKENSDIKTMLIDHQSQMLNSQQNIVMEMAKNSSGNVMSNSNNINNSHNKTFNLQFFLNETCKDAMNISEFIENIKIDVSDLENMGRVGYVEGMSSILIKNLNTLDVTRRPIHCTDKKREIVYIKDNNVWEKDDEQRNKLHRTIKRVSHKSIKTLPAYREKYPGCEFAVSKFSDRYNKMIIEVMGGPGDNDTEKEDRIIQKIAKYITINKGISIED